MDQKDSSSSNGKQEQETITLELGNLIDNHLAHCSDCHPPTKPVGLGQKTGFCPAYWEGIQQWADREGKVNNVVDHDEYGNQALSGQENPGFWWRHGAP